jgi:arylsulfatase A-like enzyme
LSYEYRWPHGDATLGQQKIEGTDTLYPKRMETVDDEILDLSIKFIDKAHNDDKPFFLWLNPTHAHRHTPVSKTRSDA